MSRDQIIGSLVGECTFGLEIGPSHSPQFPKRLWPGVRTADHGHADELRQKYAGQGIDISAIEEVDFVTYGRPLTNTINDRECFDFIYASNVIEHVPDMLTFLQECEQLLTADGVLILSVPDKRFSFDAFQSVTMTGEVLQAHADKRTRHYPGRAFDTVANIVMGNDQPVWVWGVEEIRTSLASDIHTAKARFDEIASFDGYLDEHTWRFTPSSFQLIVQDLNDLGLLALREVELASDAGFEFFVSLSKRALRKQPNRLEMLHRIAAEQVEGFTQLLRGRDATAAPAMWRPQQAWQS